MPENIFLWNTYRTRRHVAHPNGETYQGDHLTLCRLYSKTREEHERILRRWNIAKDVDKWLSKMDAVPLCKRCSTALAKTNGMN